MGAFAFARAQKSSIVVSSRLNEGMLNVELFLEGAEQELPPCINSTPGQGQAKLVRLRLKLTWKSKVTSYQVSIPCILIFCPLRPLLRIAISFILIFLGACACACACAELKVTCHGAMDTALRVRRVLVLKLALVPRTRFKPYPQSFWCAAAYSSTAL